jgi:uncharacterized protein YqeY
MLRERLADALKASVKSKDSRRTGTLRLILAALKDRDIAARGSGNTEGLGDDEILNMMQTMIRQRRESIEMYRKGNRSDLVTQEEEEIAVIESFLPRQLGPEEMAAASREVIAELGAASIKDMGRVMAELKARYAGRMDFAKASQVVKQQLS